VKKFKTFILIASALGVVFLVSGYLLSDDLFFNNLIRENKIKTPEDAFVYINKNIEFVKNNEVISGLTPRYMLTKRKYLWCDEGSIVLATIVHELGNETRLVDVIGRDNISHHTYLEILQNGKWKTYDTVLKKDGLKHEQILEGYSHAKLEGYPRPRPYPRWYNWVIQNNFYLKHLALWLRGVPG
jgi:hypothetical protein